MRLLPLLLILAAATLVRAADPVISEFMASNQTSVADEDGTRSDWIEIYNPGTTTVNLAGWYVSDKATNLTKWTFPSVNLSPFGTLLVWASGKNRTNPAGQLHTNFSLDKGGESVILTKPDGLTIASQFLNYPQQYEDTSYGTSNPVESLTLLAPNAAGKWIVPTGELTGWRNVGFNDASWNTGTQGFGYGGFSGYWNTSVIAMKGVNQTFYARLPFTVTDAASLLSVTVRTEYDDGFLTYLNGNLVDSIGAPASPAYNSGSSVYNGSSVLTRSVNPSPSLVQEGSNVIAFQGLNQSLSSSDMLGRIQVTATRLSTGAQVTGFFLTATPGAVNGNAETIMLPQLVAFSAPSGTFSTNFSLALTGAQSGQVIRYTTDGTVPTSSSTVYAGALTISASTTIRASVFVSGGTQSGYPTTGQYVHLSTAAQSFTSNLPIIVLDSRGQALANDDVMKDVHFHLFDRDGTGTARLTVAPTVSSRSGTKIRGSSSASYPKKPYGVELRDEKGFDQDADILDLGNDSDWILLAPYQFDRSFCHDVLVNELSRRMGQWAPRHRFVEVFFNADANDLDTTTDYIGVYVLTQKIKPNSERLDITKMELADTQMPNVSGGYIFKVDRVDAGEYSWLTSRGIPNNTPGYSRSQWFVHVYPESEDSQADQRTWLQTEVQAVEDALYTADWTTFAARADTASWIDHHIVSIYAKNADAFRLSGYWHKDRLGKIKAGPLWDFDRSLESTDSRDDDPTQWHPTGDGTPGFAYDWWKQWFETNPDARQAWVDRWQALRVPGGTLADATINSLLDGYVATLGTAPPARNFAKWTAVPPRGDYDGNGTTNYIDEIYHIKVWSAQRTAWIDAQFVPRPVFSRSTGIVTAGTTVTLTPPSGAQIYYTLDGTDPRAPGGGLAAGATLYAGPITINSDVRLVARSLNNSWAGRLGVNTANTIPWSGPSAETFLVSAAFASSSNLVISEVHYHPLEPSEDEVNASPYVTGDDFEFIELKNISSGPVDLLGCSFDEGAPADALVLGDRIVPAGGLALVVRNSAAFALRHGSSLNNLIAGQFTGGNLANGGETILLRARDGSVIAEVAYDDETGWPGRADGHGSSLEFIAGTAHTAAYADPASWRSSSEFDGSPGADGLGPDGRVVVNEVLTHTDLPQIDAIELKNVTAGAIDVSGWYLSDANGADTPDNYRLFRIPDGTILAAGGHLVFDERDFHPNGAWNPSHGDPLPTEFALDAVYGDDVWLVQADPATHQLQRFVDHAEFGAALNGVSLGRYPDGTGELMPLAQQTLLDGSSAASPLPKLAAPNSGPRSGPVVLNEIHYQPPGGDPEYIELRNTGSVTETLTRWTLEGDVGFAFASGQTLAPGAVLVLVPFDPANTTLANAFRSRYAVPAGAVLAGPWTSGTSLGDASGTLRLLRADDPPLDNPAYIPLMLEDQAGYSSTPPWPACAGTGAALRRVLPAGWGNEAASWTGGAPTPGEAFFRYGSWAAYELPVPWNANMLDDSDGDGLVNLLEYAFGTNPRQTDAGPLVGPVQAPATPGGAAVFDWQRRLDRPDLTVVPQTTSTLGSWADATSLDSILSSDGTIEQHRTTVPAAPARTFFRLRIQGNP